MPEKAAEERVAYRHSATKGDPVKYFNLSFLFALSLTACANPPATTPDTRQTANIPAFVPGTRAAEGDACDREHEWGHSCVIDGLRCADGGNAPASLQCVGGLWECLMDTRFSVCQNPVQQPTPSTDAGTTPVAPRGQVFVSCGGPQSNEASTDDQFRMRSLRITARERPLEVRHLNVGIEGTEGAGHVIDTEGNGYFRNFHVRDTDSAETIMGPSSLSVSADSGRRSARVDFSGRSFTIAQDATRFLTVAADTAVGESWRHDFSLQYYAMTFGAPMLPYVFTEEGDLRWSDTGETVAPSQIVYDPGCFENAHRELNFLVRPQFADITADVTRTMELPSVSAFSPVDSLVSLPFAFVNDGIEEGIVDGMGIVSTALLNSPELGSVPTGMNTPSIALDCMIFDADGHLLGGSSFDDHAILETRDLSIHVPGRGTASAMLRCSYRWPTGVNGTSITVRFGIEHTNLHLRSSSGMGRIEGTLNLENNFVAPDAFSVTLYPPRAL